MLKTTAYRLLEQAASLIAPPRCVSCGTPELFGSPLCRACLRQLPLLEGPRCNRCGAPTACASQRCAECRGLQAQYHRAWACSAYDGPARQLVGALKSRGSRSAAELMASLILDKAPRGLLVGALVPVPESSSRRHAHGFNQAELLARAIHRQSELPHLRLLERRGVGRKQVGLPRDLRLTNAATGARIARRGVVPDEIVLVDDVITTGATVAACARVLRQAGARRIGCVAFARTDRRWNPGLSGGKL